MHTSPTPLKFDRPAYWRALGACLLAGLCLRAAANPDGLLYDPQPPADSAYVRVLAVSGQGPLDVLVDGKARVRKLAAGAASDYMVLRAGRHVIVLQPQARGLPALSSTVEVAAGRALTLAFGAAAAPVVFEDRANANKLKALLSVYHLGAGTDKLDIVTADGATRVFTDLAPGTSAAIPVNPIEIGLVAARAGSTAPLASARLAMSRGGTYSVLLLPGPKGTLIARTMQNNIERYTGK